MQNNILKLRKKLKLKLKDVAERADVSISRVHELQHGRNPSLQIARNIASAFDVSVDDVWPTKPPPKMKPIRHKLYLSKVSTKRNSWAFAGAALDSPVTLLYTRRDKMKTPPKYVQITIEEHIEEKNGENDNANKSREVQSKETIKKAKRKVRANRPFKA